MNLAKSNIVLLIVAGVLAVPTSIQLFSEVESFVDYSRIPLMFDGFTSDNVGSILLAQPKEEQPQPNPQNPDQKIPVAYDQLVLQRTDDGWVVGQALGAPNELAGAPINEPRIEADVFEHLRSIRVDKETIIQANATPEQLTEYGLDEKSATLLRVNDKSNQRVVAGLYVGSNAGGAQQGTDAVRGVFVRQLDSTDVVLYEFEKGWRRDIAIDQWVDRVLLQLAPETLRRFSITNTSTGGKPMVFTRSDNEASWSAETTPEGRGAVRQTAIEGMIGRLRWISIMKFKLPMQRVANLEALGLQPPRCAFEFTYMDGDVERTATFQVGNPVEDEENVHYLTSSEAKFLMSWPSGLVTMLEVDIAEAWFDPAAPTDPKEDDPNKKPGDDKPADKPGENKKG